MKRLTAFLLVCLTAIGCLTGCGSSDKVNSSDEQAFLEKFLQATYDEPDGYIFYTSTVPEGGIEIAKAAGEWDKMVDEYSGHHFSRSTGSKHDPDSVRKVADLSDEEISYAETYFAEEYGQKVKVNSGSVYCSTVEIFYDDKDPNKLYGYMIVLDLDGEGLKICPYDPAYLKREYGDQE